MSFDEILANHKHVFTRAFAEDTPVIFRPAKGRPRSIRAIINRPPPQPVKIGEKGSTFALIIDVENDPTTGIDIRTFDPGVDKIDVPIVLGGPLTTRSFSQEKTEHDGGRVKIKVV